MEGPGLDGVNSIYQGHLFFQKATYVSWVILCMDKIHFAPVGMFLVPVFVVFISILDGAKWTLSIHSFDRCIFKVSWGCFPAKPITGMAKSRGKPA